MLTLALLLLAGRASAQAPADSARSVTLSVGSPIAFRPGELPVSVICDDVTVLRVQDAGTYLRLTGLHVGATDCSFGTPTAPGRRQLYHFTVTP